MKILHYEAGTTLYGGPYQVLGLIRHLREGFEHGLACPAGSAIAEAGRELCSVYPIPVAGESDARARGALKRLLRAERPDILHLHSRRGADLWGPMAARATGTPFVVSRRVDSREPGWGFRLKLRRAGRIIGISEKICAAVRAMGVAPERVCLVRSGVDTEQFRPRPREGRLERAFHLPAGALTVGMVAQFIPRKGHADLLAAARELIEQHPTVVFLLFGEGALREKIEAETRALGMAPAFRFPGFRDDLPDLLPELDLLAHPAHTEGLGVSLLQASACAVPIVATRAGGIPEIVLPGENGLLVPSGDPVQLGRALHRLLADAALRARLGQRGRELAEREFSFATTAARNAAIYADVLAAGS